MKSLFAYLCKHHKIGIIISLSFLILGTGSLFTINRDLFPKVTTYFAYVSTFYPGASPKDVEKQVTNKIEEELQDIKDIDEFSSISVENFSGIFLRLNENLKNTLKVQSDIQNAISRTQGLPKDLENRPKVRTFAGGPSNRLLQINILSTGSYKDLLETAYSLRDLILNIDEVSKATTSGFRDPERHIIADLEALENNNISLSFLTKRIQTRNQRLTLGEIKESKKSYFLISDNELKDIHEFENMIVRSNFDQKKIRLKDIAIIKDRFKKEDTIERFNNTLNLSLRIDKKDQADVIKTSKKVIAFIKEHEKTLPENISISVSHNLAQILQARFNTVFINGSFGLVFILLILTLFLGIKPAFFISLGIPISILGTVFFMPFLDVSINLLSLLALILVLGIIVDDAIIVVESIQQFKETGLDNFQAALQGILAVYKPVITTIITTILAFAPMFFAFTGSGKFIHAVPIVMIIALSISLIECLFALPSHMSFVSMPAKPPFLSFQKILTPYKNALNFILKKRYLASILFFIVFFISVTFAVKQFRIEFLPSKASYQFFVHFELPESASIKDTEQKALELGNLLLTFPKHEMTSFVTEIGVDAAKNESRIANKAENKGVIFVNLSLFNKRKRTINQIMNDYRKQASTLKGIKKINVRKRTIGAGRTKPIEIIVSSNHDKNLKLTSQMLESNLKKIKGVKNINRNDSPVKGSLIFELDYEKMASLSLPVNLVLSTVRTALEGSIITSLRMGRYDVDFRLKLPDYFQENIHAILDLPLENQMNKLIKLKEVATIKPAEKIYNIYHLNGNPSITITADIQSRKTSPIRITQHLKKLMSQETLSPYTQITYAGEAEESSELLSNTSITATIILIGIYLVLVLLFDSFFQPIIVLLSIPFAIFGFIVAFGIHQEPLSMLAFIGVLGLFGIIVNDSLVMVDKINQIKKEKPKQALKDSIIEGAISRLRPIVLTTISSVVGMLPIAYGIGGKDPFVQPMALAVGFGLLFSMPFILILMPCFYMIFEDIKHIRASSKTLAIKLKTKKR